MSADTKSVLPDSDAHHARASLAIGGGEDDAPTTTTAVERPAREVSAHTQTQSQPHLPPAPSSPAGMSSHSLPANDSMPSLASTRPPSVASRVSVHATPPAPDTAAAAEHTTAGILVPPRQTWPRRLLAFFGYGPGNRARKQLLSIIWTTFIDVGELLAIIVLLPLSAHLTSPTAAPLNEWDACSKPLGVWNAVWVVHAVFDLVLAYSSWSWQRRKRMQPVSNEEAPAPESARTADANPRNTRRQSSSAAGTDGNTPASQSGQDRSNGARSRGYPQWQARLSAFVTFYTVVWFVLAHILLYTSTDSCRLSSPHIWWLTFALLCVMYISVVEVLFIGIMVFIILPLVTLGFHIALLILGRHPAFNPNQINPSVDKLPKKLVDLIPLVVFIPPPPDEPEHETHTITLPAPALSYPPKPKPAPAPAKKPRFRFLRRKPKASAAAGAGGGAGDAEKGDGGEGEEDVRTWEDRWEAGKYPFVRLEENRATCAVCMEDFEAPRAKGGAKGADKDGPHSEAISAEPARSPAVEDPSAIRLEDAGQGAQPLRLLVCGHVFHQMCLDPWLTGVSGRCPTCQRPVEFTPEQLAQASRGSRRSRRRTGT